MKSSQILEYVFTYLLCYLDGSIYVEITPL